MATNSEGPVGAGLDSLLIQDGHIVTYCSEITFDEDFELEGIRTLGYHGDRFFKSIKEKLVDYKSGKNGGNCDVNTVLNIAIANRRYVSVERTG